jgi:hypothetical protein
MPLSDPNVNPVVTQIKAPGLLPQKTHLLCTWREGADERVPHKKHTLKKKKKKKHRLAGSTVAIFLMTSVGRPS